ncbi:hypothetical protein BpHYR1_014037 [Brachionus plicatilis]|uniref:Uncharacterized protein n=1 Tax=Brachionus plicatilis TaxID=10195 RepID=A0A3M7Q3I0_BRAPC|nr:hypothetical protein BpHYR1_014037 [Brachionus plicatilis]
MKNFLQKFDKNLIQSKSNEFYRQIANIFVRAFSFHLYSCCMLQQEAKNPQTDPIKQIKPINQLRKTQKS